MRQIARQGVVQAQQLMDLRERWRARLGQRPRVLWLVDTLFANPYITVARAQERLGVSNPTAWQVIALLENEGLLAETTGRSWGRLYVARLILSILEGERP